jgi:hypothetical protein
MRERIQIPVPVIVPPAARVLEAQDVPATGPDAARYEAIALQALDRLAYLAAPAGVLVDVSQVEFESVYHGHGRNEPATPVGWVFPRAEHLALFAVTLGGAVSAQVEELTRAREFALASMLDAAASLSVELAAERLTRHLRERLASDAGLGDEIRFLRYSPGYCGWHVSAQGALFARLRPEEIGISLRESFLMEPLKSITGVILGAPRAAHWFRDDFPFCRDCEDHECRARLESLR